MTTPLVVTLGVVAVGLLYVTVPTAMEAFLRYRKRRNVRCPETGADERIKVDAGHAALTSTYGRPKLRVEDCSQWPERQDCDQACLAESAGKADRPAPKTVAQARPRLA
jgi:hypothetical protein